MRNGDDLRSTAVPALVLSEWPMTINLWGLLFDVTE